MTWKNTGNRPNDHVAFHPLSVETFSVKVIMHRKALFPTPGKQGFTFLIECGGCLGR
jgi:hypothetical protein